MNLHENKELFITAVNMAYDVLHIKKHFIEKDYWICRSLQQMVRSNADHHAVFKGGTSLTKAYNIGSRFSEDIDVAIADAHDPLFPYGVFHSKWQRGVNRTI